ncbi:MAG TPA: cysteine dioxygenase family protein [Gaiellaceae bacterium]|nr:cysteine dioxygenase family protein [Gaiellaceae bacterium]
MAYAASHVVDPPRPVARTRTLRRLTSSLDALVAANTDPHVIAARAGMLLRPALADNALLEERHCEPAEDQYRQHLVHVHPAGRYSIVALVWKPGQATPIHDHRCWCVVGVWRGLERETAYDLQGDAESAHLVERCSVVAEPGDVGVLVPPEEDIHRVENSGTTLAISIHVYGADISVLGSSINHTFDDETVRTRSSAQPISWRTRDDDRRRVAPPPGRRSA